MTTLDDLLATSPEPWTGHKGIAFDADGAIVPTSAGTVPADINFLLVEAVNRIGELQRELKAWTETGETMLVNHAKFIADIDALAAERDALRAKVEGLSREVSDAKFQRDVFEIGFKTLGASPSHDQRRFEAASRVQAAMIASGRVQQIQSSDPQIEFVDIIAGIASESFRHADALLAELAELAELAKDAKPKSAVHERWLADPTDKSWLIKSDGESVLVRHASDEFIARIVRLLNSDATPKEETT